MEQNRSGADLDHAATILRQGGLVVFPTETVFGLGANAYNSQAVRNIFLAKGRPQDNPLIVHVADLDSVSLAAASISPEARLLFSVFAPGPLTIILPRNPLLAQEVSAGLDTVGVRIPSHPLARRLLTLAEIPVAAPSANRSGRPSPTDFQMAKNEMLGRVDYVLDGDAASLGLESTIAHLAGNELHILRPGSISGEALCRVLRNAGFDYKLAESFVSQNDGLSARARLSRASLPHASLPRAPGSRYRHYSPKAKVQLWQRGFCTKLETSAKLALFLPEDALEEASELALKQGLHIVVQRTIQSSSEYARELYRWLNLADEYEADEVWLWLEPVGDALSEEAGLVEALRDRTRRAAGLI